MAEIGQQVGDYQVLAQLGVGGMGRVYKVRNVISNRDEAMKILLPDFASDKDLAARFMGEIRTLANLEHPGIAQLRTAFQANNQFVMVMEYVEGTTLEKLAAATRIPIERVLDYAGQVLEALSYAHSRGVIHRDIKPANIMITTHGLVKLMDFGIAKSTDDMHLTRPGTTMGSVYYMSPEQVRGADIDARSDLYSFGVTLYEMLTGHKPFQADTSYSVLNAQLNQAPAPPAEMNPSIPPALNDIVLRALAKQPEQRFQSAAEFRDALRAIRAGEAPAPSFAAARVATTHEIPVPPYAFVNPASAAGAASLQAAAQAGDTKAPASAPGWNPVPQGAPAQVVPSGNGAKSHRGLWIGLGAVTAVLALAALATLAPRFLSTKANTRQTAAATESAAAPPQAVPSQSSDPATNSAQVPTPAPAPVTPASTPAASGVSAPPATAGGHSNRAGSAPSLPSHDVANPPARQPYQPTAQPAVHNDVSAQPATTSEEPAAPQPSRAELTDAHDRYANLQARMDTALSGVQGIRSQQQAAGYDLRGDVLAATNRLKDNMHEAESALSSRDLESANQYMHRAETDLATLEKFLGH